jgi:hypothetical protein
MLYPPIDFFDAPMLLQYRAERNRLDAVMAIKRADNSWATVGRPLSGFEREVLTA